MHVYTSVEIEKRLSQLNGWYLDNDAIRKDWIFSDFNEALSFINKIGKLSEEHNHHPELFNVYNRISLRFNTHSAKGITSKDFSIAMDIDGLD